MKKTRARTSIVIVHENKILGFHAEDPHSHQKYFFLPGGKIEDGETPDQAVVRETLEETGYTVVVSEGATPVFERYDFPWNGEVFDSQTWFFKGRLEPADQPFHDVRDTSYHQGVAWISISEIDTIFSYHPAILRAVKTLSQNQA